MQIGAVCKSMQPLRGEFLKVYEHETKKMKYQDIYDDLNTAINNGNYPYKSYLPTERSLSTQYGVSRLTVRKAIDKLVNESKVRRIQGAGNMVLVKTEESSGDLVVLAFSGNYGNKMQQPFVEMLLQDFNDQCKRKGYNLLYVSLKKEESEDQLLLDKSRVKGIVFASEIDKKFISAALHANIPVVLLSNRHPDVICINPNNQEGCFAATEHLIKKGAKKIGFIGGISSHYNSSERFAGYQRALACNGITREENLLAEGDWSFESGYTAMGQLIEGNPDIDAVVAANDVMALGALRMLVESGYIVPQDFQVIGFDDISQSKFSTPMLSTVSVDTEFVAMLVLSLLDTQANDGVEFHKELLVQTALQLRESTR